MMRNIKILGKGCSKCESMEEKVIEAAKELGLDYEIEKINDISEIAKYGVMLTPALVVDGDVKVSGEVPKKKIIKKLISL
jgi:small redox-active disulfide protein 2